MLKRRKLYSSKTKSVNNSTLRRRIMLKKIARKITLRRNLFMIQSQAETDVATEKD